MRLTQFEAQLFDHTEHDIFDLAQIEGILAKGLFVGDGLSFAIGLYGGRVIGIGALPHDLAGLAKLPLEQARGDLTQYFEGTHAHEAEFFVGSLADAGHLGGREGGEEVFFGAFEYFFGTIGLGLVGTDLGHRLIDREGEGDGQADLAEELLPQLEAPLITAKIAVHAAEVEVKLVDRGFLHTGCIGFDELGHLAGVFAIGIHIAAQDDGIRAETARHLHRHRRVHSISPRLIAAARHYPPVTAATDE